MACDPAEELLFAREASALFVQVAHAYSDRLQFSLRFEEEIRTRLLVSCSSQQGYLVIAKNRMRVILRFNAGKAKLLIRRVGWEELFDRCQREPEPIEGLMDLWRHG